MLIDDYVDNPVKLVALVETWMDAAAKEGVVNKAETITWRGCLSIVKVALRENLTPDGMTKNEAKLIMAYMIGFGRGFKTKEKIDARNSDPTD